MQTMVLNETLDRRTLADHHAHGTGEHAAASAATPELLARAGNGEQVAWDQLVDRYGGMVWAVARAHGLRPADAADVSQVTWLLLTQHLGSIQEPGRLGVWLLRTATREAYRMRRLRDPLDQGDPGLADGLLAARRRVGGGQTAQEMETAGSGS